MKTPAPLPASPSAGAAVPVRDPSVRAYMEEEAFYPREFAPRDLDRFERALLLMESGEHRQAARLLEELVARFPGFAPGHHRLALCLGGLEDYAGQLRAVESALLAAADNPKDQPGRAARKRVLRYRATALRGDALLALGRPMDARASYLDARRAANEMGLPHSPAIAFNLGLLFAREFGEKDIEDMRALAVRYFTEFLDLARGADPTRRKDAREYLALLDRAGAGKISPPDNGSPPEKGAHANGETARAGSPDAAGDTTARKPAKQP